MPDEEIPDEEPAGDELPSGLSEPARRALAGAGVSTLQDVADYTENELMKLHGMGPKALQTLRRALAAKGLALSKSSGVRRLDKEAMSRTRR